MAKKIQEGHCGVCSSFCDVVVSAYRKGNKPFLDGRNYDEVCHCCHAAWKITEWDDLEDKWIHYDPYNEIHLYSIDELIKEGWDKEQIKISLKAIKNALKHAR